MISSLGVCIGNPTTVFGSNGSWAPASLSFRTLPPAPPMRCSPELAPRPPAPQLLEHGWPNPDGAVGWGRGSSRVQLVVPLLVSRSCLRPFVVLPCLTPTLSGIAQLSFPVVGRTTGDKRTNQREKSKIGPDNRLGQGTNQLQFLLGPLLSGPLAARRPWG